ncbi:bifunctional enoyl-CoA hydratase/phosphate acetyltransferase [Acidaminobacter sp. JC074]|uniref:bifunctional enoyl-CoA hydratase/phosphate acetyltransferase n=1 Tax=Acidaminobacter sp. JC074 TaxID=2530199 RepID=UPI001F0D70EB|nr:bifunctional enoyl-CoA hydratase/phosphate acetyltransferase [Acidaminobacter sp. JC074]MCH4890351.1 bifunctional enoyl-CoA hydratase/phosphate acetyltransferase [Acidaminobacter sp. JC074]
MIKNINELLEAAKKQETMKLVVAAAQDEDVLLAVVKAAEESVVEPVLVGDEKLIKEIADKNKLDLSGYQLIHLEDLTEVARKSVELVKTGQADFVMKGLIDTSILLKAVLDKEVGLRTDSQLSHVMVYDIPTYHKLMYFTDGGMNITPDLEAKTAITKNAIQVAKALGNDNVKVACLAAKEKVNPKMPATVDAKALEEKCQNGEFGEGVIVEGPLAFDLVVSKEAAETKGFKSQIAGDVDVVVVPTIEVGNGIGKSLTYLSKARSAGIIMGAKAPVVLVSRADSFEDKLNSIALGSVIAAYK